MKKPNKNLIMRVVAAEVLVYHIPIAYLLWFFGGFGVLGLHRFYLKKFPTGVLWFFTGGLGFAGALYDFVTLPRQVRDANIRDRVGYLEDRLASSDLTAEAAPKKESLERVIVRTAKVNAGKVTAAKVALEADYEIDTIQKELDSMAKRGVCELRILKSGSTLYYFTEFDPNGEKGFESL